VHSKTSQNSKNCRNQTIRVRVAWQFFLTARRFYAKPTILGWITWVAWKAIIVARQFLEIFQKLNEIIIFQRQRKHPMHPYDGSLFSLIPLPFCAILDAFLVLNYLLLGHFPQLSFIGSLFQILSNLALIGLIFVSKYF